MKQAWKRLGSPDAISWVVVVLFSTQQIAASLAAPFVDISGRVWEFLAIRVLALLAIFIVLGIGKIVLNISARVKPKPLLTLFIFLMATLAGTIAINGLLIWTGFTNAWEIPRRLAVALPGIFTIFIVSALLVTNARELARRNSELENTADELLRTKHETSSQIHKRKTELVSTIQQEVESAFSRMTLIDSRTSSDNLKMLIDDVVRPMSYRLSMEVSAFQTARLEITSSKISWVRIFRSALLGNPAHPVVTTIWFGAMVGMFLVTGFGFKGLLGALLICSSTFFALWITNMCWPLLPENTSEWFRGLLFSGIILIFTLSPLPAMSAITGYNFQLPHVFVGWLILTFFMTWLITLVYSVNANLKATYVELTNTVNEFKREIIHLNNEFRMLQKGISRVLHGPVQEAIAAAIIKLEANPEINNEAELLTEFQFRIDSALELLNNPFEISTDLNKALRDLSELWEDVVDISVQLTSATSLRVQRDPLATNALTVLIREACSNAVRHGDAKNIAINIELSVDSKNIILNVHNDGSPLDTSSSTGLGSQIFEEMCLEWARTQEGSTVHIQALIPIN